MKTHTIESRLFNWTDLMSEKIYFVLWGSIVVKIGRPYKRLYNKLYERLNVRLGINLTIDLGKLSKKSRAESENGTFSLYTPPPPI